MSSSNKKGACRNMKKIIIFGIVLLILSSLATAFDINIYNTDMEESYLFSPGDKIIVQAIIQADNAKFELLYNNMNSVLSTEMENIDKNTFQLEYTIPKDIGKGNYLVKVSTDNVEEIREIVIGNVVVMQFIDPDNEDFQELEAKKNRLKARLEREDYSLLQKMIMLLKNVWRNYIWIEE